MKERRHLSRRWIALLLCIVMLVSMSSIAFAVDANQFADVSKLDYFYKAVNWAAENGITSGTGDGRFSPNDSCTRAQVVTFLWRAAGEPEPGTTSNYFVDVKMSDYFYKAVLWAVKNGITNGTDTEYFSPDDSCTRAQVVTFLWRAAGEPEPVTTSNHFVDVETSDYFYKAVLWAVENGITNGTDAEHFAPDDSCTRAQVVTFLYRDEKRKQEKSVSSSASSSTTEPSVPSTPSDPEGGEGTYTVDFKTDGQYLYKLVPEQMYSGSIGTVNGVNVGSQNRVKINASFVDMLFGTGSKGIAPEVVYDTGATGAAGEFNQSITNADAELELLLGRTDDDAVLEVLAKIDYDEWIVCQIDDKLVVTGWFDDATAEAARALYELAATESSDITLTLPITGKISNKNTDIPKCQVGNYLGGIAIERSSIVLRYNDVTPSDFNDYAAELERSGYDLYQSNTFENYGEESSMFKTFVKDDKLVQLSYLTESFLDVTDSSLAKSVTASFRPDGSELRIVTDFTECAVLENDYVDAGVTPKYSVVNLADEEYGENPIGLCNIFTLADGSFLVYDSGWTTDAEQVYKALKALNEREDGKIVVAAWVMTHGHVDHYGGLMELAETEYAAEITIEKFIWNSVPETYLWRSVNDPYNYSVTTTSPDFETLLKSFCNGDKTQIVHPHMGQKINIRNAELEFLYTGAEDFYPALIDNSNDSSLVAMVTLGGEKILMLADACQDTAYNVLMPLCNKHVAAAEIVQLAHHGQYGMSSRLYNLLTDELNVAVWSTTWRGVNSLKRFDLDIHASVKAQNPLNIVADQYIQTLELPFDAENDAVKRQVIGMYLSENESAKITVATLDVGYSDGLTDSAMEYVRQLILSTAKDNDEASITENIGADIIALKGISSADVEKLAKACGYPFYSYYNNNALFSRFAFEEDNGIGHCVVKIEGVLTDLYYTSIAGKIEPNGDNRYICFHANLGGTLANVKTILGDEHANILFGTDNNGADTLVISGRLKAKTSQYTDSVSVQGQSGLSNLGALGTATLDVSRTDEELTTEETLDIAMYHASGWSWNPSGNMPSMINEIKNTDAELVAVTAAPLEDENAVKEFAESCGYEYYTYVNAWTRTMNDTTMMHCNILMSHTSFASVEEAIILNEDDGQKNENNEGRAFGHVTIPWNEKRVDVYFGETDSSELQWTTLLEQVKNNATSGNSYLIFGAGRNMESALSGKSMDVNTAYAAEFLRIVSSKDLDFVNAVYKEGTPFGAAYKTTATMKNAEGLTNVPKLALYEAANFNWDTNIKTGYPAVLGQHYIGSESESVDIVAVTGAPFANEEDIATFVGYCGYEYYTYVNAWTRTMSSTMMHCNILMSHTPITVKENIVLVEDKGPDESNPQGRAFIHAVIRVNGNDVDVYVGEVPSYGETDYKNAWDMLLNTIAANVQKTGNEFVLFSSGTHWDVVDDFQAKNLTVSVASGNCEQSAEIVASNGFGFANYCYKSTGIYGSATQSTASLTQKNEP